MKIIVILTFIFFIMSCNNRNSEIPNNESNYSYKEKDEHIRKLKKEAMERLGHEENKSNEIYITENGFKWIKVEEGKYIGAKNINGETIIPTNKHFTKITYKNGYFFASCEGSNAVFSMSGKEIIPANRKYDKISFKSVKNHTGYFEVAKEDSDEDGINYIMYGICDLTGKEIEPCDYDEIEFKNNEFILRQFKVIIQSKKTLDSNGYVAEKKAPSSYTTSMTCPSCKGTGSFVGQFCNSCHGSGSITYTVNNNVNFSASSSTSTSSGASYSNNQSSNKNKDNYLGHRCGVCEGDGDEIVNVWGGSSVSTYCEKCRKTFDYTHYHRQCKSCGGLGSY